MVTVPTSGETVEVIDPADEYAGQTGVVAGVERGLISGLDVATVRLDGRKPWDVEGFYLAQIEPVAA